MRKFLLWAALLLALPVHAEWTAVAQGKTGSTYIDAATIKVHDSPGQPLRAWFMFDLANPVKGVRSLSQFLEFDCKAETMRQLASSAFADPMAKGKVLETAGERPVALHVRPGTPAVAMLKFICSRNTQSR